MRAERGGVVTAWPFGRVVELDGALEGAAVARSPYGKD